MYIHIYTSIPECTKIYKYVIRLMVLIDEIYTIGYKR